MRHELEKQIAARIARNPRSRPQLLRVVKCMAEILAPDGKRAAKAKQAKKNTGK